MANAEELALWSQNLEIALSTRHVHFVANSSFADEKFR